MKWRIDISNVTIESEEGHPSFTWKAIENPGPHAKMLTIFNAVDFHLKNVILDGGNRTEALVVLSGTCPGTTLENVTLKGIQNMGCGWPTARAATPPTARFRLLALTIQTEKPDQTGLFFDISGNIPTIPKNRDISVRKLDFVGPGVKVKTADAAKMERIILPERHPAGRRPLIRPPAFRHCGSIFMPFPRFDRSRLRIQPLAQRQHDLDLSGMLPLDAGCRRSTIPALPVLGQRLVEARSRAGPHPADGRPRAARRRVARYLIDLMERGLVSHIAMNGAGPIHDWELALIGATTESVARYIQTGEFGLWQETGRMNDVIRAGGRAGLGLGEALGRAILEGPLPAQGHQRPGRRPSGSACR